ncbi:TPA: helix-turn-helix transcriptional regulator [Salmonella enterica subsp. diarizonae serovar 61:r:-]
MNHQQLPFPHSGNARARQVAEYLGVHISTVWRWAKSPDFPQPKVLSDGITVWNAAEVRKWNALRLVLKQPENADRKGARLAKIRAEKRRERERQRQNGGEHA